MTDNRRPAHGILAAILGGTTAGAHHQGFEMRRFPAEESFGNRLSTGERSNPVPAFCGDSAESEAYRRIRLGSAAPRALKAGRVGTLGVICLVQIGS
jgi:hypothetical protein